MAPGKDTAADEETIKEKRDRAILSTLLYHALRREELCKPKVKDFRQARRGVPHIKVSIENSIIISVLTANDLECVWMWLLRNERNARCPSNARLRPLCASTGTETE